MTKILDTFWVGGYGLSISFLDKDLIINRGDYIVIEKALKVKVDAIETTLLADEASNRNYPRLLLLKSLSKGLNLTGYTFTKDNYNDSFCACKQLTRL